MPLTDVHPMLWLLIMQSLAASVSWLCLMPLRDALGARLLISFALLQSTAWLSLGAAGSWHLGQPAPASALVGLCMLGLSLGILSLFLAQALQHAERLTRLCAIVHLALAVTHIPLALTRPWLPAGLQPAAMLGLPALQLAILSLQLLRTSSASACSTAGLWRWRTVVLVALMMAPSWLALQLVQHGNPWPRFAHEQLDEALLTTALVGMVALPLLCHGLFGAWRWLSVQALEAQRQIDPETGLATRGALDARMREAIAVARRFKEPLILLIIQRHTADAVSNPPNAARLHFAGCLSRAARTGDLVADLGEDQFAIVMQRSLPDGPKALDHRLQALLASTAPSAPTPAGYHAGWAQLRPGDRHAIDLERRARAALYEARRHGGARLVGE